MDRAAALVRNIRIVKPQPVPLIARLLRQLFNDQARHPCGHHRSGRLPQKCSKPVHECTWLRQRTGIILLCTTSGLAAIAMMLLHHREDVTGRSCSSHLQHMAQPA